MSASSKSGSSLYQDEVIKLLHDRKSGAPLTKHDLVELQTTIENLTMRFDEKSIYHTAPNLIRRLIRKDMPTAKDYLRSCPLSPDEFHLLDHFDVFTLEAILIHVLSLVFNSLQDFPVVRVSTLVEQLDSSVRLESYIISSTNRRLTETRNARNGGVVLCWF